jgi:hypothetical protein
MVSILLLLKGLQHRVYQLLDFEENCRVVPQ